MFPLNSKWLALVLIAIIGWMIFSLPSLNKRRTEFKKTLSDLDQKVADAEKSKTYSEKFMSYFKSPQFLDKQARIKLNYKSPDEEVVFVFRDTAPKPAAETEKNIDQMPNYKKWWYYLFGR